MIALLEEAAGLGEYSVQCPGYYEMLGQHQPSQSPGVGVQGQRCLDKQGDGLGSPDKLSPHPQKAWSWRHPPKTGPPPQGSRTGLRPSRTARLAHCSPTETRLYLGASRTEHGLPELLLPQQDRARGRSAACAFVCTALPKPKCLTIKQTAGLWPVKCVCASPVGRFHGLHCRLDRPPQQGH